MAGRTFSLFPSNVGRKIGQTDHEPEKKNCSKTLGGKIDCGSGGCIRVCQVFQKLCLRKILCSLKVTSVGQKKSGFEPMASQAPWPPRPEVPHLEIHPLSLGKTYVEITAIVYV